MKLEPIADYLEAELINLGYETPLYIFHFPETERSGILLLANLIGAKVDPDIENYRKGRFQAIVRATDYMQGEILAYAIENVLTMREKDLGSIKVKLCSPRHDPIAFQRSDGDVIEFSVNFNFVYILKGE